MAHTEWSSYPLIMKIQPGEFDQDVDHELKKADRLCSEGKHAEATVELLGAILIEIRAMREEWRRSNA